MQKKNLFRGDYFCLVPFLKKNNQTSFFKKIKPIGFGPFGYFRTKIDSKWFFRFGLIFLIWLGFFSFRLIKLKPNRSVI